MNESTALPALTNIITRLGFFNFETISFIERAPIILVPKQKKKNQVILFKVHISSQLINLYGISE